MEWKNVLTFLLLWTVVNHVNIALYQSDASARSRSSSAFKTWFKLLSGWTSRGAINPNNHPPIIESSFVPEEELRLASQDFNLRQTDNGGCTCFSSPRCSVTCTSLESRCGRTCTHAIEFSAKYYEIDSNQIYTQTFVKSYSTGCEQVTVGCIATAVAAAAVAIAVGVAVPVGSAAAAAAAAAAATPAVPSPSQANAIQVQIAQFLSNGGLFDTLTPVNDLSIPVRGDDLPDDGCGDSSVRFRDGRCYPVLKRGPCRNPYYWITVDPVRLTGQCSPRLCGKGQVFVGADGLCHDSEDPLACRGGRKLYYTAYGDPICDCPVGQYPFPGAQDDCVTLFTQGPCPLGQVVAISRTGNIRCTPAECQFNPNLPLAPYGDGFCYALGSLGPCRNQSFQLFGYDVFRRKSTCANVATFDSPYFVSEQEEIFLTNIFSQLLPDYDDYRVILVNDPQSSVGRRNWNATSIRRQGVNTAGVFQFPASLQDPLLNPCRPGARNGNNYKCTNPLVLIGRKRRILQAVRSAFECPGDSILQATGQCGNDAQSASCGPSYQYYETTGQCRALFRA